MAFDDLPENEGRMVTAELTRLMPQDFKAQLYAALVDKDHRCLLPRVPIEWGQPRIDFTQLEKAVYVGIAIFDREDGGVAIDAAEFNQGHLAVWSGDIIQCHMGWPRR